MSTENGGGPEPTPAEVMAALDRLDRSIARRLSILERRMDALATAQAPPTPLPAAADGGASGPMPPPPTAADAIAPPVGSVRPGGIAPVAARGRRDGVAAGVTTVISMEAAFRWVGVGLVVLAAVFLVSTAVRRGWIGPELQLLGASLVGAGLLAGSAHLEPRRRPWSSALAHGGTVVLAVCAGAAHEWLALVGPVGGLALVAIAAATSTALAVRQDMQPVAATAGVVALLVSTWMGLWGEAPPWVSGLWLSSLALSAAALGTRCRWTAARLVIAWSVALVTLGLAGAGFDPSSSAELVAALTAVAVVGAVLWASPLVERRSGATTGAGHHGERKLAVAADLRALATIPLWAWTTIVLLADLDRPAAAGGLGLALAAGFAVLAVGSWTSGAMGRDLAVSHLLGVVVLTAVTFVAWLDGPALKAALAVQAAVSLAVARRLRDLPMAVAAVVTAAAATVLLIGGLVAAAQLDRIDVGPTAGHATVVAALAVMAWLAGGLGQPAGRLARALRPAQVANGVAWGAGLGLVASLLAPFIDGRGWLVASTGLTLVSLAVVRRLGVVVLAQAVVLGLTVVTVAADAIVSAAAEGAGVVGHLANLAAVSGLGVVAAHAWARHRDPFGPPLLVAAWVGGLGWLGSVLVAVPEGHGAVSATWALAGAAAVVVGVRFGEALVRFVGLVTLGVVLVKLLTVDLAAVDVLWRAGLFLVVGLGLLRLGYILPGLAERFRPSPPPPAGPAVGPAHSGAEGDDRPRAAGAPGPADAEVGRGRPDWNPMGL